MMIVYRPYLSKNVGELKFETKWACDFVLSSNQEQLIFRDKNQQWYNVLDLETGKRKKIWFVNGFDYRDFYQQYQIYPIDDITFLLSAIFKHYSGPMTCIRIKIDTDKSTFDFLIPEELDDLERVNILSQFVTNGKIFYTFKSFGEEEQGMRLHEYELKKFENEIWSKKDVFGRAGIAVSQNAVYSYYYNNHFYGFNQRFSSGLLNKIKDVDNIFDIFHTLYKLNRNQGEEQTIKLSIDVFNEHLRKNLLVIDVSSIVDPHWHQNCFYLHISIQSENDRVMKSPRHYFFALNLDTYLWTPILLNLSIELKNDLLKMMVTNDDVMLLFQFNKKDSEEMANKLNLYKVPLRKPENLQKVTQSNYRLLYGKEFVF